MSELTMTQRPSQVISKSFVSSEYNLYLHNEISHDADDYLEHFAVYHQAGPEDLIRLWIQSPGGSVSVGHQYIQHMKRCPATIVAVIGMGTASEGTAICLAADDWEVDEMSTFLVHGFSYGTYGHEAQVYNTATFNKKLNERSLRNTYSGFLNEQEILEALKGVDLLFDGDELVERLALFKEYRNSQPCNCGDEQCPQNQRLAQDFVEEDEESFSLEDIIDERVKIALETFEKKRLAKEAKASKLAEKKPSPRTKKVVEVADEIKKGFDERLDKALNLGVQSLALRVFPSWLLAKEDIQFYRATETDIVKFNVKEATAYLDNDIKVKWMVSNGSTKDLEKFQGFRPFDVYYGEDVDQDTKDYLTPRIVK